MGIRHKFIRSCISRHSGKIERRHRKVNEESYASRKFFSFDDFTKQPGIRERTYNPFPIRPLNDFLLLKVLLPSLFNIYLIILKKQ